MEDQQSFFNFMRMPLEMFDALLNGVEPRIQKLDTSCRRALAPEMKVSVTLRHLASGDKNPILSTRHVLIATSVSQLCTLNTRLINIFQLERARNVVRACYELLSLCEEVSRT